MTKRSSPEFLFGGHPVRESRNESNAALDLTREGLHELIEVVFGHRSKESVLVLELLPRAGTGGSLMVRVRSAKLLRGSTDVLIKHGVENLTGKTCLIEGSCSLTNAHHQIYGEQRKDHITPSRHLMLQVHHEGGSFLWVHPDRVSTWRIIRTLT